MKNTPIHNQFLFGADYNPEQWLQDAEILKKDIELMKKAHCNVMTLGMFSWAMLEPSEGDYQFDWLEDIINKLYEAGIYTIIGTPSGARPRWLAERYPEVLRVDEGRRRHLYGDRHNHCYTSPVYQQKVTAINEQLAKKFASHDGVILWHLSNEYGGECHCPLCQHAFAQWVKNKYVTLDELNRQWYTAFWGHTYTQWSQIESPSSLGDDTLTGLKQDWRRFCSEQTANFLQIEADAIRNVDKNALVTTNMMYYALCLDYFKLQNKIDIASWDSYPTWHNGDDITVAKDTAMYHDIMRGIKQEPFLLMESAPNVTNWQPVARQKRTQMNMLSSMQAVAHGADSVQFFQWRQSRANSEQFHGAIIDHYGKEDTRVFQETAQLGGALESLNEICGSKTKSQIGVLFDWENMWATTNAKGPFNSGLEYKENVKKHYFGLWEQGVNVDFISTEADFSEYKLIVLPMLFMLSEKTANKIESYVSNGGTVVTGPYSGVVNEQGSCYIGGTPHKLQDVLGLRTVELDGLYPHNTVAAKGTDNKMLAIKNNYSCHNACEVVNTTSAEPIVKYTEEYYKDTSALTINKYNRGQAFYFCSDFEDKLYSDFYKSLLSSLKISPILPISLPQGVKATTRYNDNFEYAFIQNFGDNCSIDLNPVTQAGWEILYGEKDTKQINKYETIVLKKHR